MELTEYDLEELERRHQQAISNLVSAYLHNDTEFYRLSEESERKYRYEKIRRQMQRGVPVLIS